MADQDFDIASSVTGEDLAEDLEGLRDDEDRGRRRRRWIPTIVAIIIVIIVWLSLRDCGGGAGRTDKKADVTIGEVKGMQISKGLVSVWLDKGTGLKEACFAAGVRYTDAIDMGSGKWVIVVREGRERSSAQLLAAQDGVHDAGLVWEDEED